MHLSGKGNNTAAYREAYDTENMTDKSAIELASRENAKVNVRSRIAELLADCQTGDITPELIEKGLVNEALNADSDGARVQAWKTLAQVRAMLKEVRETVERTMTDDEIIESIAGDNPDVAETLKSMLTGSKQGSTERH